MIEKHNTKQMLMAALYVLLGLSAYFAGYWLLRFFFWFFHFWLIHWNIGSWAMHGIILLFLLVATWSGYRMWKQRGGLASYYDSGLFVELDADTGGARTVEYYTDRVTAPAYAISQLLMAGPLCLLRARAHWLNRVQSRPGMNEILTDMLTRLRAVRKWQGLKDYPAPDHETIMLLGKIGVIDFSLAKGSPRFKALTEDDV